MLRVHGHGQARGPGRRLRGAGRRHHHDVRVHAGLRIRAGEHLVHDGGYPRVRGVLDVAVVAGHVVRRGGEAVQLVQKVLRAVAEIPLHRFSELGGVDVVLLQQFQDPSEHIRDVTDIFIQQIV